jgi:hypothetical protein
LTESKLYESLKTIGAQVVRGPAFGLPLPTLSFSLKTANGREEVWIILRSKSAEENDAFTNECDSRLSQYGFYNYDKKCERERDTGTFLHSLKYKVGSFTAIKVNSETLSGVSDMQLKKSSSPVLYANGEYKMPNLNLGRLKITMLKPVPKSMLSGKINLNIDEKPYTGLLRELVQKEGSSQIVLDIWEEDA